jgi:hypothetical protein
MTKTTTFEDRLSLSSTHGVRWLDGALVLAWHAAARAAATHDALDVLLQRLESRRATSS